MLTTIAALAIAFSSGHVITDDTVKLQDLTLSPPAGWTRFQDAFDSSEAFVNFVHGAENVSVHVRKGEAFDLQGTFVNGAQISSAAHSVHKGRLDWTLIETERTTKEAGTVYVSAFETAFRGNVYFGFATSPSAATATQAAAAFLDAID